MFELKDREITFKAKSISQKHWIYGSLITYADKSIAIHDEEVGTVWPCHSETKCQYIGLVDMHNKPIHEGDIIEHHQIILGKAIDNLLGTYVVIFEQGRFVFHDPKKPEISGHYITPGSLKIIGNVIDNPELVA